MRGLGRRLRSGQLCIEADLGLISIRSSSGDVVDSLAYSELKASDWGYIYEKHVAQELMSEGYEVEMPGLAKGFRDGGIDLVARNSSSESIYIQCKYAIGRKIGKASIEWILFKASSYLTKHAMDAKVRFWLVVPSMRDAFSMKRSRLERESYPIAQYFLSKNFLQSRVELEIREIAMRR